MASFATGGTADPEATAPGVPSGTGTPLVRGASYYLAKGTYTLTGSNVYYATPNSGAQRVIIKAVTDTDNCTNTGYSHAAIFGTVVMNMLVRLIANNFTFEGQYGTAGCSTTNISSASSNSAIALCPDSSFGMVFQTQVNGSAGNAVIVSVAGHGGSIGDVFDNVEFRGFADTQPTLCEQPVTLGDSGISQTQGTLIENAYFHNSTEGYVKVNQGGNTVTKYWMGPDKLGTNSACHSEDFAISNGFNGGFTNSYGTIVNPVGTAPWAAPSCTTTVDEWDIYGNQIIIASPYPVGNYGNGLISPLGCTFTTLKFLNNSILNLSGGAGYPGTPILNDNIGTIGTLVWQNTLWWNNGSSPIVHITCNGTGTFITTSCQWNHNSYFSTTNDDVTTGAQGGNTTASGNAGNPFINSSQNTFSLTGSTDPTTPLSSGCGVTQTLFTADITGRAFGSCWSRGAFTWFTANCSVGPCTSYVPPSLSFGNQAVNTPSSGQTITLTNTGASSLSITNIAMQSGINFSVSNTCGSSLGAGNSCSITVVFKPTITGGLSDNVIVTSSAPSNPDLLPVVGVGGFTVTAPSRFPMGGR